MAGCLKQLEAAQKFLRGIQQLPGYGSFAEKQTEGVKKALGKVAEVSPGEAANILGGIDKTLWTSSHVEVFQEILARKTRAVVDSLRTSQPQQDFTCFPAFLPDDLACKVVVAGHDKDQLLFELCAHAAKLTLRSATEASKATIIALAYWTQLRQGMSPKEKYNLYVKKKPLVTKYLSLPPSETSIAELPMAWKIFQTVCG